ncbi:MAG: hypothetical protein OEZ35_09375 [Candidatus Bathyarchaeota archaeon]|nr:hypothetical protein [Candidatus Bathyarchaeota archaeon]
MENPFQIKLVICLLFVTLLLTVSSFPAKAVVGVRSGDWVKYSVSVLFQTNIPDFTEPSNLINREWVRYEVENVVGNNVTAKVTTHYKNGTEIPTRHSGDILTQAGELGMIFIQAEIKQGDNIDIRTSYTGNTESFTVDETVSRNYIKVTREVNHLDVSFSSEDYDIHIFGYWDKATGVACEFTETASYDLAGEFMLLSVSVTLTETNIWGLSPIQVQWFWAPIVAIAVVVVVSFVFIRRSRRRPKRKMKPMKRRPRTQSKRLIWTIGNDYVKTNETSVWH